MQHVRRLYWMDAVSFMLILLAERGKGGIPAMAEEVESKLPPEVNISQN